MDVMMGDDLSDSARRLLEALRRNQTLSRGELAQAAGITERQASRLLTQLRERELIRREGGNRYGRWIVTDQ
ncbi:MAG: Lrp/AsnC family transcriptional regulator [Propionibacteriaceae bacterium]|nr:Lrp/AsnC family transcriptional regulator [Propionibacteriaceae bacterium]